MSALLYAHSGIRYLVLLAGALTILYGVFGWATKRPYDDHIKRLGLAFAGLIDLQLLMGLLIILSGSFYPALIGHVMVMVFAAVAAHLPVAVMKRRPPEQRTFAPYAAWAIVALVLIWGGVLSIGRSMFGMGVS